MSADTLRILMAAAEALAASSLMPAMAWGGALAYRKRAGMRHLAWLAALTGLLALPLLAAVLPTPVLLRPIIAVQPAPIPTHTALAPAPVDAPSMGPTVDINALLSALTVAWALGVCVLALQGLVAWLGLNRLRGRSVRHEPALLDTLPRTLTGGRPWELRLSSQCAGPMTWGLLRATVFLPWDAIRWPAERMQTVLRHELAHVRRRDCWSQALALVVRALYWPNPLVWLAVRALRREAEMAADDAVIASGVRPSDYAQTLLTLAKDRRDQRLALAMAGPSALSDRVNAVLSPTPLRTGVTMMDVWKIVFIGTAATATLAVSRPGIAEPAKSAPAPAPAPVAELLAPSAPPATAAAAGSPAHPAHPARPARPVHGGVELKADAAQSLTDADLAEMDRALARIGPEVEQAMKDAHIEETVAREIAAHQDMDKAEMSKRMGEVGPRVQKALAEARIHERIAERMAEIQPRIDAAIARAHAAAERAQAAADKAREEAQKSRPQNP